MLLEEGANIDLEDWMDRNALVHAGRGGKWQAAYMMLKLKYHEDKVYKKFLSKSMQFIERKKSREAWMQSLRLRQNNGNNP